MFADSKNSIFQLIPARGRKQAPEGAEYNCQAFQLIPARGRKQHVALVDGCVTSRFQLIPARGRKHNKSTIAVSLGLNFNLSPQGDGNLRLDAKEHLLGFQLIPARGRKPRISSGKELVISISTYPRKNPLRRCAPALPKGELLQLPITQMLSSPFGGAGSA